MQEQDTVAPQAEPEASKSMPAHYDSNPFTAAWAGIQKLTHTNAQTVVGTALFNILLFALMALTTIALLLAVAAFVVKHNSGLQRYITDGAILDFINSMSDTSIYLTWLVGIGACIFLMALTQSLQLNLTVAAAKSVSLKFGTLLKASVRTVLPILGLISLIFVSIIAIVMAIGLLSTVLGILTFVVGLVAMLAIIYVGIRISYATYSIVDLRLGPVAAMKHSWKISEGHVIETVGSGAVAWLALAIPSLILSALARATEGAPMLSGVFSLLDMVLLVVLVIVAAMSVAERYVQLQAVANKQITATSLSPFNYLAILLVIFLAPLLNALSPKLETNTQNPLMPPYETNQPVDAPYEGSSIYQLN